MKPRHPLPLLLGLSLFAALPALAQKCDPHLPPNPWHDGLETLATSEARASVATRNFPESGAATATPDRQFQHGSECLIAALRARELSHADRARVLFAEAKISLLLARTQLDPRAAVLRSRACYFLGLMAETCEQDLPAAAQYYAEADRLFPRNPQAAAALSRVRTHLERREKLGG